MSMPPSVVNMKSGCFSPRSKVTRQVVLLRDVGRLLDPQAADDVATDVEPENVPRVGLGLLGRLGELDPPGLPAAARENLGLDDHRATELRGGVRGFRRRRGGLSFGDGDAEVAKQLLPLVLVEIHAGRESTPVYPSGTIDKGGTMSVAKIVELTATGDTVENAVENGVAKASETLRNIQHVYVDALEAHCEDGRVTAYHVHLKLTFVVD